MLYKRGITKYETKAIEKIVKDFEIEFEEEQTELLNSINEIYVLYKLKENNVEIFPFQYSRKTGMTITVKLNNNQTITEIIQAVLEHIKLPTKIYIDFWAIFNSNNK